MRLKKCFLLLIVFLFSSLIIGCGKAEYSNDEINEERKEKLTKEEKEEIKRLYSELFLNEDDVEEDVEEEENNQDQKKTQIALENASFIPSAEWGEKNSIENLQIADMFFEAGITVNKAMEIIDNSEYEFECDIDENSVIEGFGYSVVDVSYDEKTIFQFSAINPFMTIQPIYNAYVCAIHPEDDFIGMCTFGGKSCEEIATLDLEGLKDFLSQIPNGRINGEYSNDESVSFYFQSNNLEYYKRLDIPASISINVDWFFKYSKKDNRLIEMKMINDLSHITDNRPDVLFDENCAIKSFDELSENDWQFLLDFAIRKVKTSTTATDPVFEGAYFEDFGTYGLVICLLDGDEHYSVKFSNLTVENGVLLATCSSNIGMSSDALKDSIDLYAFRIAGDSYIKWP